jgi:hypothetical protein
MFAMSSAVAPISISRAVSRAAWSTTQNCGLDRVVAAWNAGGFLSLLTSIKRALARNKRAVKQAAAHKSPVEQHIHHAVWWCLRTGERWMNFCTLASTCFMNWCSSPVCSAMKQIVSLTTASSAPPPAPPPPQRCQ